MNRVKLLINVQSGEAVAMKMVDVKKHPDAESSVKKEVCIQKILTHPNILKFFGKRTQGSIEYIFLEYASGGELFDRIGTKLMGYCKFPVTKGCFLFFFSSKISLQNLTLEWQWVKLKDILIKY